MSIIMCETLGSIMICKLLIVINIFQHFIIYKHCPSIINIRSIRSNTTSIIYNFKT